MKLTLTPYYVVVPIHANSPQLRLATQILSRKGKLIMAVFSKSTAEAAKIIC